MKRIDQRPNFQQQQPIGQTGAQPIRQESPRQAQDPSQVTPLPPVVTPPIQPKPPVLETLSPDQLTTISGVGGAGTQGVGTLKGTLDIQDTARMKRAFLVTANPGSRAEVKFMLDVPAAEIAGRRGESVAVSGNITKNTDYIGRITGAQLGASQGVGPGSHKTFSGTVETKNIMGIGGEAPPSGKYLVLEQPVEVDGRKFDQIFLGHAAERFGDGQALELHGRVDLRDFGGVEVRDGKYLALSGISNVTAGEPKYSERGGFSTTSGKAAPMLILERRDILDAPNVVMVPDQGADRAFVGSHGGMRIRGANPFGGFSGSAEIRSATDADRAKVKFDERSGKLVNSASGDALTRAGSHGQPAGTPDGMTTTWYYDKGESTAYRFQNGGIAGFDNFMDQVVKLP